MKVGTHSWCPFLLKRPEVCNDVYVLKNGIGKSGTQIRPKCAETGP